MAARGAVGRPFMKDFTATIGALTLDDVAEPNRATKKIIDDMGQTWPMLKDYERRTDVLRIVEQTKLDLLIKRAKELPDKDSIRYLIERELAADVIIEALDTTQETYDQVNAELEAERAEKARVEALLSEVKEQTDEQKVKHLITNNVEDGLIIEIAGVDRAVIDGVKEAMAAELREKQRKAEEEAARKLAAAQGPALEDIPPDEMLDYIEAIREIMEFSDKENEIRLYSLRFFLLFFLQAFQHSLHCNLIFKVLLLQGFKFIIIEVSA